MNDVTDQIGAEINQVVGKVVDKEQKSMFKRLYWRTFGLLVLSALAWLGLEALTLFSRDGTTDIAQRFPEMMLIIRAGAIVTWVELTLLWVRTFLQPNIDVQEAAKVAMQDPQGAAWVYVTEKLAWLARMVMFLWLCNFGTGM